MSKKKWLIAMLRLAASAVVLTLLFLVLPRASLWAAIKRLTPGVWLLTLAAYLLLHLLGVTKWRMMVNLAGGGLGFVGAVRCYYAGLFGSIYLPSIIGGDVVRAGLGLRIVRSKVGLLLGSLVDRIQDLLALAIVAGHWGVSVATGTGRAKPANLLVSRGSVSSGNPGTARAGGCAAGETVLIPHTAANRRGSPGHSGRIPAPADHAALAFVRHHVTDRVDDC